MVEAVQAKLGACCRMLYANFVKGSPPEPCEEVQELFQSLGVPKRQQLMMYQVFHELKQGEEDDIVKTAIIIQRESVMQLILERRRWCEDLLDALLVLGGCDEEEVHWDNFLYILLQFCSLSKVELCQALFQMILKRLESKVHHYLTMEQMVEFYSFYGKCPVTSFNTRAIDFTRLPLRRYYMEDFCELVQRFVVLLNPAIHLQRSLQEFMPSIDFWDNHHRTEVIIRKITCDFFLIDKTRCFLWGEPPFRESCDMLAPEALGWEPCNRDQWNLRTFDLHERVGAISDQGSFSRDGKLTAPAGFQYRSLKQYSVWGEQPSPEETEKMMLEAGENVHLSAAGYIVARPVDGDTEETAMSKEAQLEGKAKEKALRRKKKREQRIKEGRKDEPSSSSSSEAEQENVDPTNKLRVANPGETCMQAALLDETWNPPPGDMPPAWMRNCAIAPAPCNRAPDPPLRQHTLRQGAGPETMSAFGHTTGSFGSFGKSQSGPGAGWGAANSTNMNATATSLGKGNSNMNATATSLGKSRTSGFGGSSPKKAGGVKFSDL